MKLWEKGIQVDKLIESFTIGRDNEMDMYLAPYDVLGTMAHIIMLEKAGLLTKAELASLLKELKLIHKRILNNGFSIEAGVEDIHSQVEFILTEKLGDTGKKVHSGRSRNDQVLVDLKLFFRAEIESLVGHIKSLFEVLQHKSEASKDMLIPGYTHLQAAMPSSFGLWYGAYAESLADDVIMLQAAWRIVNQNPLGSAAGYGSSFPLDRSLTTRLLGFETLNYNVVYAQMGRGKTERILAQSLGSVAATLAKFAMDMCLFVNQDFNFATLPPEFTTGSSIMPHKKNPDVFELIRGKCNRIQGLAQEILLINNNLPSGYFRDYQVLKEILFPAFGELKACLQLAGMMAQGLSINKNIVDQEKYKYIFSVDEVNKLVLHGLPFRDAYRQIAGSIENGTFNPDRDIMHTHEGSIGNLCNAEIKDKMEKTIEAFHFEKVHQALEALLNYQITA
ncbi:MAG: argininosuccinate lyase [Bacteroidota bacterium]